MLNAISGANVLAEDQLFATLDPTTRRVTLPSGATALFSDTVGFIQKLPTTLVAAFRATLEEVNDADIMVHVVDASHPNMDEQVAADPVVKKRLETALDEYPNAVAFSALAKQNLEGLFAVIEGVLRNIMVPVDVFIPYTRGELTAGFHEHGYVESEEHTVDGTHIIGRLPSEIVNSYIEFQQHANELDEAMTTSTDSTLEGVYVDEQSSTNATNVGVKKKR